MNDSMKAMAAITNILSELNVSYCSNITFDNMLRKHIEELSQEEEEKSSELFDDNELD